MVFAVDGLTSAGVTDAVARARLPADQERRRADRDKAARILLSDYRNGTLGRTSLEAPGTREELLI
jgi:hypothetical protein